MVERCRQIVLILKGRNGSETLTTGIMQSSTHVIIQGSRINALAKQLLGDEPMIQAWPHAAWWIHQALISLQEPYVTTEGSTVQGSPAILVGSICLVPDIQQQTDQLCMARARRQVQRCEGSPILSLIWSAISLLYQELDYLPAPAFHRVVDQLETWNNDFECLCVPCSEEIGRAHV